MEAFSVIKKGCTFSSEHSDSPESTDIVHFYQEEHPEKMIGGKKAKVWKFLSLEQYEEQRDSLPDVCFAARHVLIKDILDRVNKNSGSDGDWSFDGLPDLDALAN